MQENVYIIFPVHYKYFNICFELYDRIDASLWLGLLVNNWKPNVSFSFLNVNIHLLKTSLQNIIF